MDLGAVFGGWKILIWRILFKKELCRLKFLELVFCLVESSILSIYKVNIVQNMASAENSRIKLRFKT